MPIFKKLLIREAEYLTVQMILWPGRRFNRITRAITQTFAQ